MEAIKEKEEKELRFDTKKFDAVAVPRSEEARKRVRWLRENRQWLKMSKEIAMGIHYFLRTNNMSQKELAEKMKVSPAYIGKLLRGEENLTLETICKLQGALGINLVNVAIPYIVRETITIEPRITEVSEDYKSQKIKCSTDSSVKYSSSIITLVS